MWQVISTAQRMNIAVRAEPALGNMQKYLDMGVKHFCSGGDMVALWQHFSETGKELNRRMGRAPPSALPFGVHRGGALPGAEAMGYAGGGTAAAVASAAGGAGLRRGGASGGDDTAKRDRH